MNLSYTLGASSLVFVPAHTSSGSSLQGPTMGAASSCCAVEEGENREVMKRDTPSGEVSHHRSTNGGKKREDRKKRQSGGGNKSSGGSAGASGGDAGSRGGGTAFPGSTTPTQADIDALRERLLAGMNTIVLLQDGTQLACLLLYNPSELCLSISCEDKVRVIPLADVKALLYTRDQLQRVETKANLVGDQCCVALHLQESGNCIPLRFDSPADKAAFVELIKRVKAGGT